MNNLNNMSFSIYLPAKSFKGTHNNTIIEGSFESGSFEGHLFFNGNYLLLPSKSCGNLNCSYCRS
ncbi:hypothetical protein EXE08_11440 [Acinetobacter pittii]|nr:hypothetical protein [Acinetobacter pittii]QEE59248.1 hypothetical protein DBQ26_21095 [Acinetobacter pittii]RZG90797.1 hypothetical protein EXE08_11440 [Acinetobacter pittii]RZG94668.1 hypothetical protein EXE03_15380 [Acinetobacter pittii]